MGKRQSSCTVRTEANLPAPRRHGFTLTELMVVVGLICVLISLLFPVIAKVRVASNSTKCASNLRQMGVAFSMYLAESRGRVPEYLWHSPPTTPDVAWHTSWLGILEKGDVKGNVLLCPSASNPTGLASTEGYGDAFHCWTGSYPQNGTAIRLSDTTWRDASYGYNRYLTAGGFAGNSVIITALRDFAGTPAFMDCVWAETSPLNGSAETPAEPPPDLTGSHAVPGAPQHWMFLISRHGRGINVCMADGSVNWVPLEETYMLSWKNDWVKYPLTLPPN